MKITAILATILFTLFALVQVNDPDPFVWILIYGYAAVMSFLVFKGKYFLPGLLVGAAFYLSGCLLYFPDSVSKWIHEELNSNSLAMKTPDMEVARESFGMLIAFLFMSIFLATYFLKQRKKAEKPIPVTNI